MYIYIYTYTDAAKNSSMVHLLRIANHIHHKQSMTAKALIDQLQRLQNLPGPDAPNALTSSAN